ECPFITTWETKTANETITIPTVSEETYNYTVDWGDGSDITTHANATPPSHTYDEPNTYTITISGTFPRIYFRYFLRNSTTAKKIRTIEKWGDNRWTSMQSAFAGCNNLTIADEAGVPNLSNVTDMSGMFYKAASFNQDISNWNVSSVTDMSGLFEGAASFNQDISDWEVSNVTNMLGMFAGAASFNQDISNWEVSNVTNMSGMFAGAVSFNQDISNWEVSSVTDMSDMFLAASFNQDISMWDVSSVTDMSYMFRGVFNRQGELLKRNSFNGDLSMWDVSSVTDMRGMFSGASFNQDISMWDVSSVTDMRIMFENNTSISSENYDKLLIGWSTLDDGESQIPNGITFGAPGNYTCVGADARETLVKMQRACKHLTQHVHLQKTT
ncbi:MAG: DUF285 domain-containing protein, partial [Ekhidna sp.]|nr:DUF285 domain-containing protein [Ekhidna sp.]